MMQSTPKLDVRFWLARLDMQYILGLFQLINTGINEYVQYQQAKAADYQHKYMRDLRACQRSEVKDVEQGKTG